MDAQLRIRTLGSLSIELDGHPLTTFGTRKVQALLVYLASTGRTHPREILAELFWEERTQSQALSNLRVALTSLRQTVGPFVDITRETVGINPDSAVWLDTTAFETRLDSAGTDVLHLEEAIDLYQGDFLAGSYVDSTAFEEWATRERERLRLRAMEALDALLNCHMQTGDYAAGIAVANRLLEMDNLREETHRQLMELLWHSGQRAKALEQYETCRRLLDSELGIEPTPETDALHERIRTGETSERAALPPPVRGYEIRERIGAGSHGEVYRAFQPIGQAGRVVAIKVIRPEYANHPDFIRRFETEAQLIAQLQHPNIVPLIDYWREPTGAYMVMTYQKESLLARLQRGPLSVEETALLVDQIAAALDFAHRQGVIHRDLKPANVLLDGDGNAYLTDFGIAKVLGPAIQATLQGALVGSPGYLSPEQINGENVTPQSDLYSFGILLYETLTSQSPFPGDLTFTALMHKQLHEPVPSLLAVRPDLPPELDDIIQMATAKDPVRRYVNAPSLAAAFREASQGTIPRRVELLGDAPTWVPSGPVRNPYKGLRAFTEADAGDFFGRDELIKSLVARLEEDDPLRRFLAVVGPSGSGKSSVVRAGLIPALRGGQLDGSQDWFIAQMLPGTHPIEETGIALNRIAAVPDLDLIPILKRDERGLLQATRQILPGDEHTLLLVIDQFEEVFTLVNDPAEARHFMASLYAAVTEPRSPLRIIITLRADFYDRPLMYPNFSQLVKHRTEVVVPLTPDELMQAICRPAENIGVALEPELTTAIVTEVNEQPGALPLLQFALTEVFENRQDNMLTLDAYHTIGGVRGALARQADAVFTRLQPQKQATARQLFLRLVTLGEGVEDTRRRVLQSELLTIGNGQTMQQVIDAFDRSRLLTFDHDPVTRGPTVEVAHEAILREWGQLREWLDESRDAVRLQRLLSTADGEWRQADQDASFLLSGSRLAQFEEWAAQTDIALTADELAYLKASVMERERLASIEHERQVRELALQHRAANQLRYLVTGLVVFLAAMTALSIYALSARASEQHARSTSDANALLAESNAAEAQELALVNGAQAALAKGELDTALALAVAANRMPNPSGIAQAILAEAAYAPGTTQVFSGIQEGGVFSIQLSPDGTRVLSTGGNSTVVLHDRATGDVIYTLRGHSSDRVWFAAFSPDGRRAVSGSIDHTVVIWDLETGLLERRFEGDTFNGGWVIPRFSPDGQTIFSTSGGGPPLNGGDPALIEWDPATGQPIRSLAHHAAALSWFDFTPDGRAVLVGYFDGVLILWDLESGEPIRTFGADGTGHTARLTSFAFSADGHTVVTAGVDGLMIKWDLDTAEQVNRFELSENAWTYVVASPDGYTFAGIANNLLSVWDFASEQRIAVAGETTSEIVAFTPDGQQLIIDQAGTLRAVDPHHGGQIATLHAEGDFFDDRCFGLSPDGRFLAAINLGLNENSWQIVLFDTTTGEVVRRFDPVETGFALQIAFLPDGQTILTIGDAINLWDVATGHAIWEFFAGHASGTPTGNVSPDGRMLVVAHVDGTLDMWDLEARQEIFHLVGHTDFINGVDFTPDGRYILSSSQDHTLRMWDAATGTLLHTFEAPSPVNTVGVSPDGRYVLAPTDSGLLVMWDLATRQEVRRLSGHVDYVNMAQFSPDGRWAISSAAEAVLLWDVASGEAIRRYPPNDASVIALSPDGRSFWRYDAEQGVFIQWRIDSRDELMAWTQNHRYVRELTCNERTLYQLEPGCDADGVYPTGTPYLTAQPTAVSSPVQITIPGPTGTSTLTVTPRPIDIAQIGQNRGQVAIGDVQIWYYTGKAGESLSITTLADQPANWSTRSEDELAPEGGVLDTVLAVSAPNGRALTYSDLSGLPIPNGQDIDPGVNTNSRIQNLVLPTDGIYQIEVSGFRYETGGAYTLIIESQMPSAATPESDIPPDE